MSNKTATTKNNVVKNKVKLSDLKSKAYTFELIHPEMGPTGATLTIVSTSTNIFFLKTMELNQKFGTEDQDKLPADLKIRNTADLYASIVTGWDENFFEKEFNTENVTEVLSNSENFWILNQIIQELAKSDNFFPKI